MGECFLTCKFEPALGRGPAFWTFTVKTTRFNQHGRLIEGPGRDYREINHYYLADQIETSREKEAARKRGEPGKYSNLKWFEFGDKLCMHVIRIIHDKRYRGGVRKYIQDDAIVVKDPAIREKVLEWLRRHPELTSSPNDLEETAQFKSEFENIRENVCKKAREHYASWGRPPYREYLRLEDL